jgi:hypothetical protein
MTPCDVVTSGPAASLGEVLGPDRSRQVRFIMIARPKPAKKTFGSLPNEGAQMSSELESDKAMVVNFRVTGVDGAGYYETETESPRST